MIILPAHCSNEHNNEGANIAVVYPNVQEIGKIVTILGQVRKKNRLVFKLCCWTDRVNFYFLHDCQITELVDAADFKIEDQLFFRKPDDIMEELGDPIRTECDQLVIRTDKMIEWTAYDHYCGDTMETDQIHLGVLKELMRSKKGK